MIDSASNANIFDSTIPWTIKGYFVYIADTVPKAELRKRSRTPRPVNTLFIRRPWKNSL